MIEPARLLRRALVFTALSAGGTSVLALLVWGGPMALGVMLGALVGLANLWLLARTLSGLIANAEQHRPPPGRKWSLPLALVVKWPLLMAAIGVIILYLPVRPEGVAVGVVLSLAAASIAALPGSERRRAK